MAQITITIPNGMTISQVQSAIQSFGISAIIISFPPSVEAPQSLMIEETPAKSETSEDEQIVVRPGIVQTGPPVDLGPAGSPVPVGPQAEIPTPDTPIPASTPDTPVSAPVCASTGTPLIDQWVQDEAEYGVCDMEIEMWDDECDVQTDEECD